MEARYIIVYGMMLKVIRFILAEKESASREADSDQDEKLGAIPQSQ